MKEITRYDFVQPDNWQGYHESAYMEACDDGEYVSYDDYAWLKAELEDLKEKLNFENTNFSAPQHDNQKTTRYTKMNEPHTARYAYSIDYESYHGDYDTPELAAHEAFAVPDIESAWIGEIVPIKVENLINSYGIVYDIKENAWEMCGGLNGEWLEDTLGDDPKLQELKIIIADWVRKQDPRTLLSVTNIRRITRQEHPQTHQPN